jgi:polysaccharide deacetylase family protein (PEP-CTERM system associated)
MTIQNMITVDVEDWFHICGVRDIIPEHTWQNLETRIHQNISKLLQIFDKNKVKATFFTLGYIAEKYPELVQKIQKNGHEIATHGYSHRRVYTMTPETFREDLKRSTDIISHVTGIDVRGFRAPEWSIRDDSLWALDILQDEGFEYDSSKAPLHFIGNPNYPKIPHEISLKNGKIWEIPPLVGSMRFVNLPIAGGWGLRVFPYRFIHSTIKKLNDQGHPALIYVHPREFDPAVPHIQLPLVKKFVLNAKLVDTEKRLQRLLKDFRFSSIISVLEKIKAKKV